MKHTVPPGWLLAAHEKWLAGQRNDAIAAILAALNAHGVHKPKPLMVQFGYYLFMIGDWPSASRVLENAVAQHGPDWEVFKNISVARGRMQDYAGAIAYLNKARALNAEDFHIFDGLAHAYANLGRFEEAAESGTRSLQLKDAATRPPGEAINDRKPAGGAANVVAFSLWGANPRYLRGALRNVLLMEDIYPGWRARFYLDASVPRPFADVLESLGAELRQMPQDAPTGDKLVWRFLVANDPGVDRFMVRDCDSVIGVREAEAVSAWMASGRSFHVMRDWWTHTDLMLAGMWGGRAGLLPDLQDAWRDYAPVHVTTDNVDQWFLRDCIWPLIRGGVVVHDRCFRMAGSTPFPATGVPPGNAHVGQDEFAARRGLQTRLLAAWIEKLPMLAA